MESSTTDLVDEEALDKFFRNEERLWKEMRKLIPRAPPEFDEEVDEVTVVEDIADNRKNNVGGGDSSTFSALERAEAALVGRTISGGSRQSKSILTLPRPMPPPPPQFCLPSPSEETERYGKPPGTPIDPNAPTSLERDIEIGLARFNNSRNVGVSARRRSTASLISSITSLDECSKSNDASRLSKDSSFSNMSKLSESVACGGDEQNSNPVDEGGDRGIMEKFHELCLKYNFDLPLEEGHGSVKDLLLENKKTLPPPSLTPGEGAGDFMKWPVLKAPTKTHSTSSYKSFTNSSTSLSSNCNFATSSKPMKAFNPYKPAGLKSGLSSLSVPGNISCSEVGVDSGGMRNLKMEMTGSHPGGSNELSSSILDLYSPAKDGIAKQDRFHQDMGSGFQRRGKMSASASSSVGALPSLPVPRCNMSTSSSSAGSLRNKPPLGPPRTSVISGKSHSMNIMNERQSKKSQIEQAQDTQPFRRPFGGITYSKKFTGPTFKKKGVSADDITAPDLGWKTVGRQSAYFPNAGLAHPLAPTMNGDNNNKNLSKSQSLTSGPLARGSLDSSKSLEHMIVGPPPPPPGSVVTASDLFELKNNIHRHHDPHRQRRQLR